MQNKSTVKPLIADPDKPDISVVNNKDQADILGKQYFNVSHDNNLEPNFLEKRNTFLASREGSVLYDHQENTNVSYNNDIKMHELTKQLRKRKKTKCTGRGQCKLLDDS